MKHEISLKLSGA